MKHSHFSLWRSSASRLGLWALTLTLTLVLTTGCVTRKVKEIVANSNAATLQATLGVSDFSAPPKEGVDPVAAIDIFIAAHPDQPKTRAALRIRQAMLLLAQGKFATAKVAFDDAKLEFLVTDRDIALKRLQGPLLWYYAHSTNQVFDSTKGDGALTAFQEEIVALTKRIARGATENVEIRDRLAERRVQLGLSLAKQFPAPEMRKRLEAAMNDYSDIFTTEELNALLAEGQWADATSITPAIKRRAQAFTYLREAKRQSDALDPKPQFKLPELQKLINGQ